MSGTNVMTMNPSIFLGREGMSLHAAAMRRQVGQFSGSSKILIHFSWTQKPNSGVVHCTDRLFYLRLSLIRPDLMDSFVRFS